MERGGCWDVIGGGGGLEAFGSRRPGRFFGRTSTFGRASLLYPSAPAPAPASALAVGPFKGPIVHPVTGNLFTVFVAFLFSLFFFFFLASCERSSPLSVTKRFYLARA